jgi:tRNA-Thr(GGU) m(6)t(6)A37 methyltransferase TsaA
MTEEIVFRPIGVIRTPFEDRRNIPIQPSGGRELEGRAEVFPPYIEGLGDVEGFSHVYLIYHFHLSRGYRMRVVPFLDTVERGLFATRAPRRPNPIGISVVEVAGVKGGTLHFRGVNMVNGSPLLDIKPCVGEFDLKGKLKVGWLEGKARRADGHRSDDRFGS